MQQREAEEEEDDEQEVLALPAPGDDQCQEGQLEAEMHAAIASAELASYAQVGMSCHGSNKLVVLAHNRDCRVPTDHLIKHYQMHLLLCFWASIGLSGIGPPSLLSPVPPPGPYCFQREHFLSQSSVMTLMHHVCVVRSGASCLYAY